MKNKALRAFSFSEFSAIAKRDEADFADFGTVVSQGSFEGSTYTFKDNGSDVLGIAHVDTVQQGEHSSLIKLEGGEQILLCPRLDDRLGVYIITRLLPALGITCDWLLTTGEETGNSSAELFRTAKRYNWAFSFDRAGDDVVLYQYEHKRLRRVLRRAGFRIAQGAFSDLSALDIGCSGINFGCGYYDAHGRHAYARLSETFAMVNRFALFYGRHANVRLPFDPNSRLETMTGTRHVYGSRDWRGDEAYSYYGRDGYHENGYGYVDHRAYQDQYLKWYEVEEGISKDEQLEILADEAQNEQIRAQYEDNGR